MAGLLAARSKKQKSKKNKEEAKWNPVNPVTPAERARAVIGNLVKTLHEVPGRKKYM